MPAGDFRTVDPGAEGRGFLLQPGGTLLAASVAPRPRAAEPEERRIDPRHVLAALAGAAESDRHLDRQAGRYRRECGAGTRPRLPRRDAAVGLKTGPLRVHPAGATAGRRLRDGVRGANAGSANSHSLAPPRRYSGDAMRGFHPRKLAGWPNEPGA